MDGIEVEEIAGIDCCCYEIRWRKGIWMLRLKNQTLTGRSSTFGLICSLLSFEDTNVCMCIDLGATFSVGTIAYWASNFDPFMASPLIILSIIMIVKTHKFNHEIKSFNTCNKIFYIISLLFVYTGRLHYYICSFLFDKFVKKC